LFHLFVFISKAIDLIVAEAFQNIKSLVSTDDRQDVVHDHRVHVTEFLNAVPDLPVLGVVWRQVFVRVYSVGLKSSIWRFFMTMVSLRFF
jgi:hypothetical protein